MGSTEETTSTSRQNTRSKLLVLDRLPYPPEFEAARHRARSWLGVAMTLLIPVCAAIYLGVLLHQNATTPDVVESDFEQSLFAPPTILQASVGDVFVANFGELDEFVCHNDLRKLLGRRSPGPAICPSVETAAAFSLPAGVLNVTISKDGAPSAVKFDENVVMAFDDASDVLHISGGGTTAGNKAVGPVSKWNGTQWESVAEIKANKLVFHEGTLYLRTSSAEGNVVKTIKGDDWEITSGPVQFSVVDIANDGRTQSSNAYDNDDYNYYNDDYNYYNDDYNWYNDDYNWYNDDYNWYNDDYNWYNDDYNYYNDDYNYNNDDYNYYNDDYNYYNDDYNYYNDDYNYYNDDYNYYNDYNYNRRRTLNSDTVSTGNTPTPTPSPTATAQDLSCCDGKCTPGTYLCKDESYCYLGISSCSCSRTCEGSGGNHDGGTSVESAVVKYKTSGASSSYILGRFDSASQFSMVSKLPKSVTHGKSLFIDGTRAFFIYGKDSKSVAIQSEDSSTSWQQHKITDPEGGSFQGFVIYKKAVIGYGDFGEIELTENSTEKSTELGNIAALKGDKWSKLGKGVGGKIYAAVVFDNELVVGGDFRTAGDAAANGLARWNGRRWATLRGGSLVDNDDNAYISSLVVHKNKLYVGGTFERLEGVVAVGIAVSSDDWQWSRVSPLYDQWVSNAVAPSIIGVQLSLGVPSAPSAEPLKVDRERVKLQAQRRTRTADSNSVTALSYTSYRISLQSIQREDSGESWGIVRASGAKRKLQFLTGNGRGDCPATKKQLFRLTSEGSQPKPLCCYDPTSATDVKKACYGKVPLDVPIVFHPKLPVLLQRRVARFRLEWAEVAANPSRLGVVVLEPFELATSTTISSRKQSAAALLGQAAGAIGLIATFARVVKIALERYVVGRKSASSADSKSSDSNGRKTGEEASASSDSKGGKTASTSSNSKGPKANSSGASYGNPVHDGRYKPALPVPDV